MEINKSQNYSQHQLSNGLRIHLKEIHTSPLISSWIWYRVGLRNEKVGKIGTSHWVEHMQFKGTSKFPTAKLDKLISRAGGQWNAFTHLDWTTYFETLPAYAVEIALDLEADRMVNSKFSSKDVERERTVVISEREGAENNPLFLLDEAISLAAFDRHPYRYEVGGEVTDLKAISREDLFKHYQNNYHPANATLCISGDFETKAMLILAEKYFGEISAKDTFNADVPLDPFLLAEKRLRVTGPGTTQFLQIAYRSPAAKNTDFFALTILDSLLSGPSGFNMFGSGSVSNKTSRLYQILVEDEIAVSAHGSLQATIDPYLYNLNFIVHPNHIAEDVLSLVDDQIHQLQDVLVNIEEIQRAIKQAHALFAYGSENITNQAFWMGYADNFADYSWFTQYVEYLSQVTPADVQHVAQSYLCEQHRVVGVYQPGSEIKVEIEEIN